MNTSQSILAHIPINENITQDEICEKMVVLSEQFGYPIRKAKWNSTLNSRVGFGPNYTIYAEKRTPADSSWELLIIQNEPLDTIVLMPIRSKDNGHRQECGEMNKITLLMLKELYLEGLEVEVEDGYKKIDEYTAIELKVCGHEYLVKKLQNFADICLSNLQSSF